MKKIVVAGACRTPIGSFGGGLSTVSAVELGALVIKEVLERSGIQPEDVDQVYMGNVIQAGQGQNPARQAAVKAGIPVEVPAITMNVVCGSGLECVNMAARMIQTGEAEVVVAGGMENMSMAPYILNKARFGYRMGNAQMIDAMVQDALWDAFQDYHMGITAENVAEKWEISRKEMDVFALESQRKAAQACKSGRFAAEIVPVRVHSKKGMAIIDKDEGPRPDTTLEKIEKLPPAFKKDGRVTAANSSSINDGAAALVIMSEEKAKELKLEPLAYWKAGGLAGVEPYIMGIGPVKAVEKVLKKLDISIDEVDLIEANEAFAAQAIAVQRELQIPQEKLNVNGGAIALGHPVGASGTRIMVTLLYEMQKTKVHRGLATLCIGGGMGCATVVERF